MTSRIQTREQPIIQVSQERLAATRDSVLAYGAAGGDLGQLKPLATDASGTLLVTGQVLVGQGPAESLDVCLVGRNVDQMLARLTSIEKQLSALTTALSSLPGTLAAMAELQREFAALALGKS